MRQYERGRKMLEERLTTVGGGQRRTKRGGGSSKEELENEAVRESEGGGVFHVGVAWSLPLPQRWWCEGGFSTPPLLLLTPSRSVSTDNRIYRIFFSFPSSLPPSSPPRKAALLFTQGAVVPQRFLVKQILVTICFFFVFFYPVQKKKISEMYCNFSFVSSLN